MKAFPFEGKVDFRVREDPKRRMRCPKVSVFLPPHPSASLTPCLAAARSRRGSDVPPACHSLPRRRFATLGGEGIRSAARRYIFFWPPSKEKALLRHRRKEKSNTLREEAAKERKGDGGSEKFRQISEKRLPPFFGQTGSSRAVLWNHRLFANFGV